MHLLLCLSILSKRAHFVPRPEEQVVDIFLSILLLEHEGDQHEGGEAGDTAGQFVQIDQPEGRRE